MKSFICRCSTIDSSKKENLQLLSPTSLTKEKKLFRLSGRRHVVVSSKSSTSRQTGTRSRCSKSARRHRARLATTSAHSFRRKPSYQPAVRSSWCCDEPAHPTTPPTSSSSTVLLCFTMRSRAEHFSLTRCATRITTAYRRRSSALSMDPAPSICSGMSKAA